MRFLPISFADGIALHSDQSLDAFLISRWLSMWDTCQLQVHELILGSVNSTFQRWSLRWQKTDANIHQPVIQKITFRCKLYCICESVTTWSIFKLHARAGAIQECRRSWLMKKKIRSIPVASVDYHRVLVTVFFHKGDICDKSCCLDKSAFSIRALSVNSHTGSESPLLRNLQVVSHFQLALKAEPLQG